MERVPSGVDAARLYLQKRIERCNARIALTRRPTAAKSRRRAGRGKTEVEPDLAARRAYRDALRSLDAIPSSSGALAPREVDRVKSALAKIYEVAQHSNHDIADGADWAIVEGEAQDALNVFHEVETDR